MGFRTEFLTSARLPERVRSRAWMPAAGGCVRPKRIRSCDFHLFARELALRA
ncbi:MAG: hypothetical protein J0H34_05730 [Rhizobiales bacterium]|nr:hypothetical protein [Hyphomicrobiales bacterium]